MTTIAKWYKKGNIKVGAIWTFSLLMGDNVYHTVYGDVTGTCGKHCSGCKARCYVKKSYRYLSVIKGHARNTVAMRLDPFAVADALSLQIQRARKRPVACRLHQSGEIENLAQFLAYCRIAKENPDMPLYIYTKNYKVVVPALLAGFVPGNLTVLISVWHENGIKEFNRVKHLDNVKAFVYIDGFNYTALGMNITTMCAAYDKDGKMNHSITCDVCQKCFNRAAGSKCVGCYDH